MYIAADHGWRFRSVPARGRRGQAMIESALVITAFFFLFMGIIEFGLMVYSFNYASTAASQGALYASIHGATATGGSASGTVWTNALVPSAVGVNTSNITVTLTDVGGGTAGTCPNGATPIYNMGDSVRVDVRYNYTPMIGRLFGSTIALRGSSTMIEIQPCY